MTDVALREVVPPVAPPFDHVAHVVEMAPDQKMVEVGARWVVARVPHFDVIRQRSVFQRPDDAVDAAVVVSLPGQGEHPVANVVDRTVPFETASLGTSEADVIQELAHREIAQGNSPAVHPHILGMPMAHSVRPDGTGTIPDRASCHAVNGTRTWYRTSEVGNDHSYSFS